MPSLEFHFDFGSPNAYLAHRVIPQIEARLGARFTYVPVLLGGVFKATNNMSPAVSMQGIKNKPQYMQIETRRFLEYYGIEGYAPNPHFPVNTLPLMRGAVYALGTDYFETYVHEVYRHMWQQPKDMGDLQVIDDALNSSGLPTAEILAGIQQAEVKQGLISNTEQSVQRGTFGAPTFYVDDELFFGKETLREVEEWFARLSQA